MKLRAGGDRVAYSIWKKIGHHSRTLRTLELQNASAVLNPPARRASGVLNSSSKIFKKGSAGIPHSGAPSPSLQPSLTGGHRPSPSTTN